MSRAGEASGGRIRDERFVTADMPQAPSEPRSNQAVTRRNSPCFGAVAVHASAESLSQHRRHQEFLHCQDGTRSHVRVSADQGSPTACRISPGGDGVQTYNGLDSDVTLDLARVSVGECRADLCGMCARPWGP